MFYLDRILATKEAGLFNFWMLKLKAPKEEVNDQAQDQTQSDFGLEHFDIYFYMYIGGSILSCMYFAVEYFHQVSWRL